MYPMEHKTPPPNDGQENENFSWKLKGKWVQYPNLLAGQYRPPQPDTNPNVRKDKTTEKKKRVVPTKRFRANTVSKPSEAAA